MSRIDSFFNPRSVILIGAAHTETKFGGIVLKNLLSFRGKVYPVNPKYKELMGLKAYPSVEHIPFAADLAIIMRPAVEVPGILSELKGKVGAAIVVSSGFAEIGEAALQDRVKEIGRESGIRLLGPNCLGIYNPYRRFDTYFLPLDRLKRPPRGNLALISQSGAMLSCLFDLVRSCRAGVSSAVGYGNAVDIDDAELYEHFAEDPKTAVVLSYIESAGDGRKFLRSAAALSERKPLLILKAGKGAGGLSAAYSHTGRLAGSYEVFRSALRQFGVREASGFDELIDYARALSYQRPAKGARILIVTNGGGLGVLATDECARHGLEVPHLGEEKKDRLSRLFPNFFGLNNPVDLTAQVADADYLATLRELRDDYDAFLVIALPNVLGITLGLADVLRTFREEAGKPLVVNLSGSGITPRLTVLLEKAKIPVFDSPERAVRGLRALLA